MQKEKLEIIGHFLVYLISFVSFIALIYFAVLERLNSKCVCNGCIVEEDLISTVSPIFNITKRL